MKNNLIIDSHGHLGSSKDMYYPDVSVKKIIKVMDNLHIDKMLQTHMLLFIDEDAKGVRDSISAYDESEGRILSYLVFNPKNPKESLKSVSSNINKKQFVGVKIHPSFHTYPADGDEYDKIWKFAYKNKVILLTHSWAISPTNPNQSFSQVKLFEKYIQKYPDVKFILGHGGGLKEGILKATEFAKKYKNVYLDIAGDILYFGLLEMFIENGLEDKVLFGSDLTMLDPRINLGRIYTAKISVEAKKKILGLNAMRIFKGIL